MTTSRWHFATCCFLKLGVHSRGSCFQSRPGFRENCVPRRQSGRQQGSCTHEFNRIHGREQAWTLTNRFLRHPSRAVGCFPTSKWNRRACWQGAHVFSFPTGALQTTCNPPPAPQNNSISQLVWKTISEEMSLCYEQLLPVDVRQSVSQVISIIVASCCLRWETSIIEVQALTMSPSTNVCEWKTVRAKTHIQQQIKTIDCHARSMTFVADVCKRKCRTMNVWTSLAGDVALRNLVNGGVVLLNVGGVVTANVCS